MIYDIFSEKKCQLKKAGIFNIVIYEEITVVVVQPEPELLPVVQLERLG
jgi:hypothetical protein